MRRLKRFLGAITLATTLFLSASFGREPEEPPEDTPELPIAPVAYDDSAELAELERQKQAYMSELARAKAEEAKSQAILAQTYEATFYTAFCPTGCTGVTASGYDVSNTIYYDGMRILAAPKHIPLYSIMRVTMADGSSFDGVVLDRGGDIGNGRLDVLVKSRDEAYRLGRQSVEVRMIRKGR